MNLKNKVNIHNRFDIEVRDAKTGLLKKSLLSYNIVLNQMYTRLCGGLSYFVNIHFGSSTGTLSATRTSLFNHLGTKAAVDEEIVKAIPLSIWKRKIVLNPEEFVGSTISEVGIAFGATNTNLVTHSLLKDSEGNPISIVKTETDVITIYATVFVTFDNSNPNLVYIGMPSSNALVNYLIGGATAPTGAFGVSTAIRPRSYLGNTPNVTWTSDTANKQRKTNVLRFGTTVGNGQVKFLEFANVFSVEFPYNMVFNGQSYEGVSMFVGDGTKNRHTIPSANIKSDGLLMKKNGLVTADYTKKSFFKNYVCGYVFTTSGSWASSAYNEQRKLLAGGFLNSPWFGIFNLENGVITNGILPSVLPTAKVNGVSFSENGLVMSIIFDANPRVLVFDWDGSDWNKRADPSVLPSGNMYGGKLSLNGLVLAILCTSTPYLMVYDWDGSSWNKRPNPSVLPSSVTGLGFDMSDDGNVFAIIHESSPYITVYDWDGFSFIKRQNPSILPSGYGRGIALNASGDLMVCSFTGSPFFSSYDWDGSSWNKRADPSPGIAGPNATAVGNNIGISKDGMSVGIGKAYTAGVQGVEFLEWDGYSWIRKRDMLYPTELYGTSSVSMSRSGKVFISAEGSECRILIGSKFTEVKFNTPPAIGDVITADYTVDGVHKTDQYVIDVSMAIQFGEGS